MPAGVLPSSARLAAASFARLVAGLFGFLGCGKFLLAFFALLEKRALGIMIHHCFRIAAIAHFRRPSRGGGRRHQDCKDRQHKRDPAYFPQHIVISMTQEVCPIPFRHGGNPPPQEHAASELRLNSERPNFPPRLFDAVSPYADRPQVSKKISACGRVAPRNDTGYIASPSTPIRTAP